MSIKNKFALFIIGTVAGIVIGAAIFGIALYGIQQKNAITLNPNIDHITIAKNISDDPNWADENIMRIFGNTHEEIVNSVDFGLVIFTTGYLNGLSEEDIIQMIDESESKNIAMKEFLKKELRNTYFEKALPFRKKFFLNPEIGHTIIAAKLASGDHGAFKESWYLFGDTEEEIKNSVDLSLILYLFAYLTGASEEDIMNAIDTSPDDTDRKAFLKDTLENGYFDMAKNAARYK